ncbi:MAG: 50S ribosomal protein L9 [Deltaproteobacteria bacterium]|jgi:large subunit ribosomal protein L9|nr:50S ribosomal protein L9 [Deltaproteobacteria bacterium]MCL5880098.1 50S ribosomal protein L9 [Deltaproteobacteria bacterium]MDA8304851.1 50S ribosomal protein L9 [Deltaproteobacteria bacterium]
MKVILKEDIQDLGAMGDMVNVADGYGRNFLLPKKLAIPATKVNIKTVEHEKRLINKKKEKILREVTDIKNNLEKAEINIAVKVGENDKIFGSITSMDIEDKLREIGFNIDRKSIMLDSPIKDLGIQTVKIKLHPEIIAEIKVDVVPE